MRCKYVYEGNASAVYKKTKIKYFKKITALEKDKIIGQIYSTDMQKKEPKTRKGALGELIISEIPCHYYPYQKNRHILGYIKVMTDEKVEGYLSITIPINFSVLVPLFWLYLYGGQYAATAFTSVALIATTTLTTLGITGGFKNMTELVAQIMSEKEDDSNVEEEGLVNDINDGGEQQEKLFDESIIEMPVVPAENEPVCLYESFQLLKTEELPLVNLSACTKNISYAIYSGGEKIYETQKITPGGNVNWKPGSYLPVGTTNITMEIYIYDTNNTSVLACVSYPVTITIVE